MMKATSAVSALRELSRQAQRAARDVQIVVWGQVLARRSLATRTRHNAATAVTLTNTLLAQHRFTEAKDVARTLVAWKPEQPRIARYWAKSRWNSVTTPRRWRCTTRYGRHVPAFPSRRGWRVGWSSRITWKRRDGFCTTLAMMRWPVVIYSPKPRRGFTYGE